MHTSATVAARADAMVWKVAVVGHGGSGKTQLEKRAVGEPFETQYVPTIGVDFHTTFHPVPQAGKLLKLQIWDVAGQPRFRPLDSFLRGYLPLVFVLYDVAANSSIIPTFDAGITKTLDMLRESSHIVVVGNKADLLPDGGASLMTDDALQQGALPPDAVAGSTSAVRTADAFCKQENLPHYVVSAKTNENVERVIQKSVEASLAKCGYPCTNSKGGIRLPLRAPTLPSDPAPVRALKR